MPLIQGTPKDGYLEIKENIRFRKGVDFISNWGKTYFVDFENGSDYHDGRSTFKALKNLAAAISKAAASDVIYIRPRGPELGSGGAGPYYGGDPGDITPATAANWIIPYTKYGLSLIGCGNHKSQTCLQGYAALTGSPVLDIRAPYCNIENLAIKPGGSTTGLISQKFLDSTVYQAWANTYYKVWLRNVDAQAAYSLNMDSGTYDEVIGCIFSGHPIGIQLSASNDVPKAIVIRGCIFDVLTASVKCDIYAPGAVARILITECNFPHVLPSGGSPNKYIVFSAASTGLFSNSFIGATTTTVATNTTLNGVGYSGIEISLGLKMIAT